MPRLGELLIAAGVLDREQVEEGLRAQIMWGGRLGTSLVELDHLSLDTLAKAVGRQCRLPAALAWHFDTADRALQERLPAEIAERYSCLPLLRVTGNQVVIASISPLDERARAVVAGELDVSPFQLVPAIAAELRIRYQLERIYKIPRATRFLRSRNTSHVHFPQFEINEVVADDVDLELPSELATGTIPPPRRHMRLTTSVEDCIIPATVDPVGAAEPLPQRDRRTYVPTLADAKPLDPPGRLGRIALKRITLGAEGMTKPADPSRRMATGTDPPDNVGSTLGAAARAIRISTDRDQVAELVIGTLSRFVPACRSAVILVVRGDVAIGWTGFRRDGMPVPDIGVPLDEPGLVPEVIRQNIGARMFSGQLTPIDSLLLQSLGGEHGDLLIEPIPIAGQVMCAIAIAANRGEELSSVATISMATGAAFARLMRESAR